MSSLTNVGLKKQFSNYFFPSNKEYSIDDGINALINGKVALKTEKCEELFETLHYCV